MRYELVRNLDIQRGVPLIQCNCFNAVYIFSAGCILFREWAESCELSRGLILSHRLWPKKSQEKKYACLNRVDGYPKII